MYRTFGEISTCGFSDTRTDRKIKRHTDTLIAILHTLTGGEVKSGGGYWCLTSLNIAEMISDNQRRLY